MPHYCFFCLECDHRFSEVYKVDERNIPCENPCPNCKKENTIKHLMSAPGAILFDSLVKPPSDFRERMSEIKRSHRNDPFAKIKDY